MNRFKIEGARETGYIITKAPSMMTIDGNPVLDPTDQQYEDAGYYPMTNEPAESREGKVAILVGYSLVDKIWHTLWEYEDAPEPEPETIVISKYKAEGELFRMGKLDMLDTLIDSQTITNEHGQTMSLRRKYNTALTFSTADPYFSQYAAIVKESLQIGDSDWNELLEKCRED